MSVAQPTRSGIFSGRRRMIKAWLSAGLGAAGPPLSVIEQPASAAATRPGKRRSRRRDAGPGVGRDAAPDDASPAAVPPAGGVTTGHSGVRTGDKTEGTTKDGKKPGQILQQIRRRDEQLPSLI